MAAPVYDPLFHSLSLVLMSLEWILASWSKKPQTNKTEKGYPSGAGRLTPTHVLTSSLANGSHTN
jgi:hypothetical protein